MKAYRELRTPTFIAAGRTASILVAPRSSLLERYWSREKAAGRALLNPGSLLDRYCPSAQADEFIQFRCCSINVVRCGPQRPEPDITTLQGILNYLEIKNWSVCN
ncbi:hypothetical protein SESBI_21024 [Sesbania bispinosa]|nr:hypothetical protein SESBI_21024 [Sesbania bispinosa]